MTEDWLTAAIERQALPKHLREGTVETFCAQYEIDVKQYYYQLSKPENQKRILGITLGKAKDAAPEVLDKLVERAKDGDMRAMEIYVNSILQLAKNLDLKTDGKPLTITIAREIAEKHAFDTSTGDSSEGHS